MEQVEWHLLGIEEEVTEAYAANSVGLFRCALALTRNRATALDAMQESFLRYCATRRSGQAIREPRAWLFRVLRNHLIDQRKAWQTRNEVPVEELRDVHDARPDPEADYHGREISLRLQRELAPRELACLRLRAQGLQYQEIAEMLTISTGTVGALLARAHKKLRRVLDCRQSGADCKAEFTVLPGKEHPYAS